MLVKYIDENTIEIANKYAILKYEDVQVINPKDEDFIKAGYKELVVAEEPTYNEETQYLAPIYEELNDKILQLYVVSLKEVVENV